MKNNNKLLVGTTESDRALLKDLQERALLREKIQASRVYTEREQLIAQYERLCSKLDQQDSDVSSNSSEEYFDCVSDEDQNPSEKNREENIEHIADTVSKKVQYTRPNSFEESHPLVPYYHINWDWNE